MLENTASQIWNFTRSLLVIGITCMSINHLSQASVITAHGLTTGDQTRAEQLFHEGMQAYMSDDFQQAYARWKQAEAANHAKAVFNLGRMWLLGQVPQQIENPQFASNYFQKAASLGYLPAQQYLSQSVSTKSQQAELSSDRLGAPDTFAIKNQEGNTSAAENYRTDNSWLNSYPDNAWVIQVFASQEASLLRQMIRDYSLKNKAKILTEKINDEYWYKLIYGQYPSKQQALDARSSLPSRLQTEKPWVRAVVAMKNVQKG